MELWCRQMKYHLLLWNSMELWESHFMTCYPGLPRNIPRKSTELWSRQIKNHKKNHRDPWDSMELGGRHFKWHMFHGIPWNSMELWCCQMQYHLVPWSSMELWDCHFIQCHATLEFHGIYYGILWNSIEWPNKNSPSSMGFHGIRRAPLQMTQVFHGIPWNIPWNSMEYFMEFHGTLVAPNEISISSMEFHGIFHGIPWNSGAAKWHIT